MVGGTGDDVYHVDSSSDVVTEYADEGTDTVRVKKSSYTLPANVENADLRYYSGSIAVTGNSAGNVFIMGTGAQSVNGSSGVDTLQCDSLFQMCVSKADWYRAKELSVTNARKIQQIVSHTPRSRGMKGHDHVLPDRFLKLHFDDPVYRVEEVKTREQECSRERYTDRREDCPQRLACQVSNDDPVCRRD
jgi:Ca2+-binding RTX toxin-like protein